MVYQILTSHTGYLIQAAMAAAIFLAAILLRSLLIPWLYDRSIKRAKQRNAKLLHTVLCGFRAPVQWGILLLGAYVALRIISLPQSVWPAVYKLIRIACILLVAWGLSNSTDAALLLLHKFPAVREADQTLRAFFSKVIKGILYAITVVVLLSELGYNVNGLITGLGLSGLTIALAAKDAAANLFGGLVIIFDKPFAAGDYIKCPSAEGTVEEVNLRSTRIRSADDMLLIIPNSTLSAEPITNYSRMNRRRVVSDFPISSSTPLSQVQALKNGIQALLQSRSDIEQNSILILTERLEPTCAVIRLYYYTISSDWSKNLAVKSEIIDAVFSLIHQLHIQQPVRNIALASQPDTPSGSQ